MASPAAAAAMAVAVALLMAAPAARSDLAKDKQECANQLVGLATCLVYVQGSAAAPTPDCCSGLKEVLAKSPKCLCLLIRDRNDPDLGIAINLTRALSLPDSCHAAANISRCPELLNLPANSPEAQVFKNFTEAGEPAEGSSAKGGGGSGASSTGTSSTGTRRCVHQLTGDRRWLGPESSILVGLLLVLLALLAA
ncbi:putative GPI-anchored protein [Apostasia shenzhenica]|uniref:Putative GPI-anchored protein n=1 Tax=Apostasia shenzhenica TaxID=1088818 RepID=A0A2I0ART5_9ASPA|nr:putative GPI-anchored protein [Apostasia shenzhenica]